jgi:hypothetical protein
MSHNPHIQSDRDTDIIQANGDVPQIDKDNVTGDKIIYTVPPPQTERERRNRTVMLQKVHDFWVVGVLENSLWKVAFIENGRMHYQQDTLANPRNLHHFDTPDEPLPPDTSISSVFATVGGELLILGAPGAGKTTMLLELARDLLERARNDDTHPIPVVFNLSTWHKKEQDNQLSLADWLVGEVVDVYDVPRKLAQAWIDNNHLLLLLDGLDDVPLARRAACVEAINTFRQENRQALLPLVVCSRIADYEMLDTKLRLRGAVCLQPLTQQQVADYFSHLDTDTSAMQHAYTRLWEKAVALQNSAADKQSQKAGEEALQSLSTPLLLSIITLTYADQSPAALPDDPSLRQIFGRYVERMVQPRPDQPPDPHYSPEQATHWLSWLAARMLERGQTVFYLEKMQPDWVTRRNWLYRWLAGTVVALVGVQIGGLLAGILGGILGGVIGAMSIGRTTIDSAAPSRWSWQRALTMWWVIPSSLVLGGVLGGPGIGMVGWLFFGLSMIVSGGIVADEIETRTRPNAGIWRSVHSTLLVGLGVGVLGGLVGGIIFGLVGGISSNVLSGLIAGLVGGLVGGVLIGLTFAVLMGGGLAVIQHVTLRFVLALNNHAPLNYVRFLDYASGRILLRKVGGGYIFVHRMLLEYFAGVETEDNKVRESNQ